MKFKKKVSNSLNKCFLKAIDILFSLFVQAFFCLYHAYFDHDPMFCYLIMYVLHNIHLPPYSACSNIYHAIFFFFLAKMISRQVMCNVLATEVILNRYFLYRYIFNNLFVVIN